MDRVNRKCRSRIMVAIKGKGTGLELKMASILDRLGVKYVYQPGMFGKPDFLAGDLAIFVDGCF